MQDSKLEDYVVDVQQRSMWAYKNHNNRFANYIGISSKHRLRIKNDLVAKTNAFTSWKAHDAELCTRWVMTCIFIQIFHLYMGMLYSFILDLWLIESYLLKAFNSLNHNFHILYGCEINYTWDFTQLTFLDMLRIMKTFHYQVVTNLYMYNLLLTLPWLFMLLMIIFQFEVFLNKKKTFLVCNQFFLKHSILIQFNMTLKILLFLCKLLHQMLLSRKRNDFKIKEYFENGLKYNFNEKQYIPD